MLDYIINFLVRFISEFWYISCLIAPWLLFGFFCGGLIAVFVPDSFIRKHLGGKGLGGIIKASLIGMPLPLCSCGVIPVAATLKRQGAGNGTIASFITSTPQISLSSFLPAWQLLSPAMALIRTLFAFLSGILSGILINAMCPAPAAAPENPEASPAQTVAARPQGNKIVATFRYAFGTLMGDVGGTLLFGLAISALLGVFMPADFGAQYASNTFLVIPLIILISLPMYTCTNAAIPIAAMLMMKGFSPGAAMAFLIAGPSCSAPMLVSFWKLLGRRAMLIYIAMMIVMTLAVCWGIDLLGASIPGLAHVHAGHQHGIPLYQQVFAGLMLAIMVFNWTAGKFRKKAKLTAAPGQLILSVPDMTCAHCRQTIADALNTLPGVSFVEADQKNRQILVQAADSQRSLIGDKLKEAGFNAQ
jgi:hypothetical protein